MGIGVALGHPDQLIYGAGIGDESEMEGDLLAEVWIGVIPRQLLEGRQALRAAFAGKTEGCLPAEAQALPDGSKLGKDARGRRGFMEADGHESTIGVLTLRNTAQHGYALLLRHAGEPCHSRAAGIDLAPLSGHVHLGNRVVRQAEEYVRNGRHGGAYCVLGANVAAILEILDSTAASETMPG